MSKKGGKIKPSQILLATSGALGIGSGATALTGVGLPASAGLAAASGISLGVSKILQAFGAGLNKKDLTRLQNLRDKHKVREKNMKKKGGSLIDSGGITPGDLKFLDRIVKRGLIKQNKLNKKGGSIKVGGSVSSGGSLKTKTKGGSLKTKARGTKRQVWNGTARRTSGGLTKNDLMLNKKGKVVSKKKHAIGVKRFKENKLKPKTKEEMAELRSRRRKK